MGMSHNVSRSIFWRSIVLFAAAFALSCSDGDPNPTHCADDQIRNDDGECVASHECTPPCVRGECDDAGECVNPDDCTSPEARCLEGFLCHEGTCERDLCAAGQVECDRGVCAPQSGDCIDADSCTESAQCLSGKRCLDASCTPDDQLCGDGGCPGDQICDFDEQALSAECIEPTPCSTSVDCLDGRVCAGRHCLSAPTCEPDALEPNDTAAEAAVFENLAHVGALSATLCAEDRDVYTLEVPRIRDAVQRRDIHVALDFPPREVGLGDIEVELIDPDGQSLADERTVDGHLDFTYSLGLQDEGSFRIVVDAAEPIAESGLHYTLFAAVQPRSTGERCDGATVIEAGQTVTGDTSQSSLGPPHSRCTVESSGGVDVYAVDIAEKTRLTAQLTASAGGRFALAFRSECRRADTEAACSVIEAPSQHTLESQLVEPGRYFLLVQSPTRDDQGSYTLSLSSSSARCTAADDSCTDTGTAQFCNSDGSNLETRVCDDVCQPHTGRCAPRPAETCQSAPSVTETSTFDIDWSTLDGDYEIHDEACVPVFGGSTQTDGADAAYRIALPPDHAMHAELRADDPRDVALYLLSDCIDPDRRCIDGANEDSEGPEELTHWSGEDAPETLYLVADSIADTRGQAELDITIAPVICDSWEARCDGDDLQKCNTLKTGFETIATCEFGCADTACSPPPGDRCDRPHPLGDGDSHTGDFDTYSSRYDSNLGACSDGLPADDSLHEGPDAFFSVQLDKGDMLEATLTTDAEHASLYVVEDCTDALYDECLWGADDTDALDFWAPRTGRYLLVVDTAEAAATGTFEIAVDIAPDAAVCQPGGAHCDASTGELVQCNSDGSSERYRYACQAGCSDGLCSLPSQSHNTCQDALDLSGGARLIDNLNNYTNDFQSTPLEDGPDAVYRFDLAADDVLDISLETSAFNATMYLVSDCGDLPDDYISSDRFYASLDEPHFRYHADSAETVYLIVDSGASFYPQDREFLLDARVQASNCSSGDFVCDGSSELLQCNQGLFDAYPCGPGGCADDKCVTPTGDICYDAIEAADGDRFTGTFEGTDDLTIAPTQAGECLSSGTSGQGYDTFYRVDLQPGDLLEVTLQNAGTRSDLYFVEDCNDGDSCTPGLVGGTFAGSGTAHYYSEDGGPVYAVVDGLANSNLHTGFEVEFDVTSGAACRPSKAFCQDATTVAMCNDDGTAVASSTSCPGQCARGGCIADPTQSNSCATAPLVDDGFSTFLDFGDFADNFSTPDASCTTDEFDGNDAFYRIDVDADEVLHVRATGLGRDPAITVIEDCASAEASCVAGSYFDQFVEGRDVFYAPSASTTLTVVVDGGSPAAISMETLPTQCSPGARQCSADGSAVEICSDYRRWRTVPCLSGCAQGSCTYESGEYCEDAIELNNSQTVFADLGEFSDDIRVSNEACGITYRSGREVVYAVPLAAGQVLSARLIGQYKNLYLLDDCDQHPGRSCVEKAGDDQTVQVMADQSQTYYVVVERSYENSNDRIGVEFDITSAAACPPGSRSCDAATSTLEFCADDGSGVIRTETCPLGCDGDLCAAPSTPNSQCADALDVGDGIVIRDDLSRFSADFDPAGSCGVSDADGSDAVYAVDLQAGEAVEATLRSLANYSALPRLFIATDCSDVTSSCVAGAEPGDGVARAGYLASSDETVYIVADYNTSYSRFDYELDIDVRASECTPGASSCPDASTAQACTAWGLYATESCRFGCSAGRCNPPADDTCSGATMVPRDDSIQTHTIAMDDYADDYNPILGSGGECVRRDLGGTDAVFELSVQAGDLFSASWPAGAGVTGWLASDCPQPHDHCVATHDNTGAFEHVFETSGTYWFILDNSLSSPPSKPFELDLRLAPQTCVPGTRSCSTDSPLLSYCDGLGTEWKDYACDGGCDDSGAVAKCNEPRGERCVDAIDATGGGLFEVKLAGFDSNLGSTGIPCATRSSTYSAPGGDAFYRVDLQAGDRLDATVTPHANGEAIIYLLDDCMIGDPQLDDHCQAGAQSQGQGTPATLDWTAPSDTSVYLVVDTEDEVPADTPWTLDLQVQ